MALPIPNDSGKSLTSTPNTFLGIRPGTVVKKDSKGNYLILKQANRDAVNAALRAKDINNLQQARARLYSGLPPVVGNPTTSIKYTPGFTFSPSLQTPTKPSPILSSSTPLGRVGSVESNVFVYKGGQYSGIGNQARAIEQATEDYYAGLNYKGLAKLAAERDSTIDFERQQYLTRFTLPQDQHDLYIATGERWIADYDALYAWILGDLNIDPDEEIVVSSKEELAEIEAKIAAAEKRQKRVENWFSKYLIPVTVADPEANEAQEAMQIAEDAPLPPWILATSPNLRKWDYYTTYSHDVVQATSDAYYQSIKDSINNAARPYKSAFDTDPVKSRGITDSLIDAVIADIADTDSLAGSHTLQYLDEYLVNPVKNGKFGVAALNRLYSLMDVMDAFARGTRAITASQTALGGMTEFEDQSAYWAFVEGYNEEDVKHAQEVFLESGGLELLSKKYGWHLNDSKAMLTSAKANMSEEELEALIDQAFRDFGIQVPWRKIFDDIGEGYFGRGLKERASAFLDYSATNLKDAYTVAGADFNADTGSVLNDMILEMATDPGFVVGGIAKSIAKNGVESITTNAFKHGITEAFKGVDVNKVLNNKGVRTSLKRLTIANKGKYLLFRNADDISSSVDMFIETLKKTDFDMFKRDNQVDVFREILKSDLLEQHRVMNANILSSASWSRKNLNSKLIKTADAVDHAIDAIDVALIKSAFPEPFLIRDVAKLTKKGFAASSLGKYIKNKKLRRDVVARAVVTVDRDGVRKTTEKLLKIRSASLATDSDLKFGVRKVSAVFDDTVRSISKTMHDVRDGLLTVDDAEEIVEEYIKLISDVDYKTIDELEAWVDNLDTLFKGEYQEGLLKLKRQYSEFKDYVLNIRSKYNQEFLDELSKLSFYNNTSDDYFDIFLKYSGSVDFMYLRRQIKAVVPAEYFNYLIKRVDEALNAGLPIAKDDVFTSSLGLRTRINHGVSARELSVKFLNSELLNLPSLKRVFSNRNITTSGGVSYSWTVRKLYYLFNRNTDTINYDIIYKTLDSSIKNVSRLIFKNEADSKELNRLYSELLSLQDSIKNADKVSIKDVDTINELHLDMLSAFNSLLNDASIKSMLKYCDDLESIFPSEAQLSQISDDLKDFSLLETYTSIFKHNKHIKLFQLFDANLRAIPSLSESKIFAIESALLDHKFGSRDIFDEITRKPDGVWDYLNEVVYNNFGDSKLNMNVLNEHLRSLLTSEPTDLFDNSRFVDELRNPENSDLRNWFNNVVNASTVDPQAYVDKQMLAVLLMDPDAVKRYNKLANDGETPIFLHLSSTGLNTDADYITGIGYRMWTIIDDPDNLSLSDIRRILSDNPTELRVGLTDSDIKKISHDSLRQIFNSDESLPVLRSRYKKVFGVKDSIGVIHESEILEQFFKMLYKEFPESSSYRFVVHDLQSVSGAKGYNMAFLNKRSSLAAVKSHPFTAHYSANLANHTSASTLNTLSDFRLKIDDNGFTDEEFFEIEKLIKRYAIKRRDVGLLDAPLFDFNFLQSNIRYAQNRIKSISKSSASFNSNVLTDFINNANSMGYDSVGVQKAIINIEAINASAKKILSFSRYNSLNNLNFYDSGYYKHLESDIYDAFNNLSTILGTDINFTTLKGAYGLQSTLVDEGITKHEVISLEIYAIDSIYKTFIHEMRHALSFNDEWSGLWFNNKVKAVISKYFDDATVKRIFNGEDVLSDFATPNEEALEEYISYQADRYPNVDPSSDLWMEEFVAPIFEEFFDNPKVFDKIKLYMENSGFLNSPEGQAALSFLDSLHTIKQSSDTITKWSGGVLNYSSKKSQMSFVINDVLNIVTSEDELIEEFAQSLLHIIKNKDVSRKALLKAFDTGNNIIPLTREAMSTVVLNSKNKIILKDIRTFFDLSDSLYLNLFSKHYLSDLSSIDFDFSLATLNKMNEVTKYIKDLRERDLTCYADDILEPYSDDLSKFLEFVKDVADLSSGAGSSRYDYLRYLNPKRAFSISEKFLLAQYIYDDCFKYVELLDDINQLPIDMYPSEFIKDMKFVIDDLGIPFDERLFNILSGDENLKLFKSGLISDGYKRRFKYALDNMSDELNQARAYRDAMHDIASNVKQREQASLRLRLKGIVSSNDHRIGKAFQSLLKVLEVDSSYFVNDPFGRKTVRLLSESHYQILQQYRLSRLKSASGDFDFNKLFAELLYNGHNHISFQTNLYTPEDVKSLMAFVDDLKNKGIDYISSGYDGITDKYYIFLNKNKCKVFRDTSQPVERRYIEILTDTGVKYSSSFTRPQFDNIHGYEFLVKPFKRAGDSDNLYNDIPYHLVEDISKAWKTVDILSEGVSRGTSGRVVSRRELEHYYNTLPSFMKDLCLPDNLLKTEETLVYDPGFIIDGTTDYFLDLIDTMHYQTNVFNQGAATLASMFGNNSTTKFRSIMDEVPDADIIDFFSKDSDFVVATVVPSSDYLYGVEVKQLRMDTARAVEYARETENAVILPFDIYNEVAVDINRFSNPESVKMVLNKALLVVKAFQLCNVGSWVRNWYDATKKAAMDMGAEPSNTWLLLMYQGKAIKDMAAYRKILKQWGSNLDEASFEIMKKTFKTDMTFEDYEILSNMFHSDGMTLDSKYFKSNKRQLISGSESGVRGLSEQDIKKAFDQTFGKDETVLSKARFLEIHQHLGELPTDKETELFDSMVRSIDNNLRSTKLHFTPDKAINTMFHPFSISENVVRYAQTQYLRDFGMTNSEISRRIHLTQFGTKRFTNAASYLEYAIPYVNYSYDNVMYWMRLMEENPRYFKYFSDAYGNIASSHIEDLLDKNQEIDIDNDYMLKTGGIPIGHDGLYFKLNPSFFDFLHNIYGGTSNLIDKLNPLLNLGVRYTLAELGLGSKYFFSDLDLDISEDDIAFEVSNIAPGVNHIYNYYRQFNRATDYFGDDAGIPTKVMFALASPLLGFSRSYSNSGQFIFEQWLDDLAKEGKWYDSNLGKIVPLESKNEFGANDPDASWEDKQAYQLTHFGYVWDGNQKAFVSQDKYIPGGANEVFDFDNDPDAWDKLLALQASKGMVYDYNLGKFVHTWELTQGDLNDPNITWDQKQELMFSKFNKRWDANRHKFVVLDDFLRGGLNDSNLNGKQKAALRLALFGKVWDSDREEYVVVDKPKIVLLDSMYEEPSGNLYSKLGLPQLEVVSAGIHVNSEGFLVTKDGQYVLTNDRAYNERVFAKFTDPYIQTYFGRQYEGYKNRAYNALRKKMKQYKGRTLYDSYHRSVNSSWSKSDNYYTWQFQYNYQYHNPQPSRKLRRLLSPHIHYPFGGGYNRYSFYSR